MEKSECKYNELTLDDDTVNLDNIINCIVNFFVSKCNINNDVNFFKYEVSKYLTDNVFSIQA